MQNRGMTLVELLVIMVIFIILTSATLTFLSNLTKRSYQEAAKTRTTQTGIVSESILLRDVAMAGLGVPVIVKIGTTDYFVPIGSNNNNGQNNSDELIIKGASISSAADNYMKWGYNTSYINASDTTVTITSNQESPAPSYPNFPQFESNDKIVFLNTETKELFGNVYTIQSVAGNNLSLNNATGFIADIKTVFAFSLGGISQTDAGNNINTFQDYFLNTFTGYRLCSCNANNICSLCRVYGSAMPILDGVLDFQVQFGLIDPAGNVTWKDDISGEAPVTLKNQLRLVRIFIVKQYGRRDPSYNYPNALISTADNIVNLNNELRHYRWRTITLEIPLRELQ